jgi:hypothetical protein
MRMTRDVGDGLLDDPVRGYLHRRVERRQHVRCVDVDARRTGTVARREPAQRRDEAELVERRRTQPVDQPADVADERPDLLGRGREQRVGAREIRSREIPRRVDREREPGKSRTEPVVEVAADSSPLLFAKPDEACASGLELVRELDRMDGAGDLRSEIGDQPFVTRPQALAETRRHLELTDRHALVDERIDASTTRRDPVGGDLLARRIRTGHRTHADVFQCERAAECLDRRRKDLVDLEGAREGAAQARDRKVGIVPLPVHQPVDDALDALAHRLKADRDEPGDDERDNEVAAA